jgi:hypothetical protein
MTIERQEEPQLMLVAVCDDCGDRVALEATEEAEAAAELDAMGWRRGKPDKVKFPAFLATNVQTYANDLCGDCQTAEPKPKPLTGSHRVVPIGRDAFANDPCDEWPRSGVFVALGLRADCGHPKDHSVGSHCGYCSAGCAIGDTRPAWRRAS